MVKNLYATTSISPECAKKETMKNSEIRARQETKLLLTVPSGSPPER